MRKKNDFNHPSHFEHNTEPSMTVPGMAMPLEEIIRRYSVGQQLNIQKSPIFDEDIDIDHPDILRRPGVDITDVQEHYDALQEKASSIGRELNAPVGSSEPISDNQTPTT